MSEGGSRRLCRREVPRPWFFERPEEAGDGLGTFVVVAMVLLVVALMLVGLYTVAAWFF